MGNSHLFAPIFMPQPQLVGLTCLSTFRVVVSMFLVVVFAPTVLK